MQSETQSLTERHLDEVRAFYEGAPPRPARAARDYRDLLAHYYNLLIPASASVLEVGCGSGHLLSRIRAARKVGVDLSAKQVAAARQLVPEGEFHVQSGESLSIAGTFDFIILSDTLNLAADVQQLLARLHEVSHPGTRLVVNFYSQLWRPILDLARFLRLADRQPENSWLSAADVRNLLILADWQPITVQPRLLLPVRLLGLEKLVNRWIAPLFGWLCLTVFCVARSTRHACPPDPSVSVVIPARNEAGNIEAAVTRIPRMGRSMELIFVEGHSKDNTWDEIQRVAGEHPELSITCIRQTGIGKGDAVRAGFAVATGDILMILDADLTVPPEELPKFYDVVAGNRAEFANGCRLVYPMERQAMQLLNTWANKVFGILFTWLLGQPIKDTLCGTKALSRRHYERIAANRPYFGDFDPFGDFDLLFGAAKLNLRIADVPIRYRERTYGSTNISRFRHGWLLLRMTLRAARTLKFV